MTKHKIFTHLALILVSGILLHACTKEPVHPDGPDEPKTNLGEGVFSFRFHTPRATKSAPAKDEEGTLYEQVVENVWLLLYDAETGTTHGQLKYAWNLDIKKTDDADFAGGDVAENPDGSLRSTSNAFITKARKVKRQNYKMVVIANPGYYEGLSLTRFTNGSYAKPDESAKPVWTSDPDEDGDLNPDDVWFTVDGLKTVNGHPDIDDIHASKALYKNVSSSRNVSMYSRYFLMSNANGLIHVAPEDIYDTAKDAEDNSVKINIDRAVAKVMVNAPSPEGLKVEGAEIISISWQLKNINTKTYMYRQVAPMFDPYISAPYQGSNETEGEVYSREYLYAVDPNFEQGDQAGDHFYSEPASGSSRSLNMYRNIYDDDWNVIGQEYKEDYYAYIPENTLSFQSQAESTRAGSSTKKYADYATMIRLKAYIRYDFADGNPEPGRNHYYSYSYSDGEKTVHKVFSLTQFKTWFAAGQVPDDFGEEFKYYTGIETNPGYTVSSFFENGESSEEPLAFDEVVGDNNGIIFFHPDALNIYEIDIKHFNYSGSNYGVNKSYGYLGVVRNNVYRININSIEGPGVPTGSSGYISADVTINPWYVREDEVDL